LETFEFLGYSGALIVGLILGLTGSGGSILSYPILKYLFGFDEIIATAYSLFIVGTTSFWGSLKNFIDKLIDFKNTLFFAIPAGIAAFLCRFYLTDIIEDNPEIPIEESINILYIILMLVAGFLMVKKTPKTIVKIKQTKTIAPNKFLIFTEGSLIGLLTGLIGAGGGFIIVPILVILSNLRMKIAIATSLAIISIKSLLGFLGHLLSSDTEIQWLIASDIESNFSLVIFSGISILGIIIGNNFSAKTEDNKLKNLFSLFIIILAIIMIYKEFIY